MKFLIIFSFLLASCSVPFNENGRATTPLPDKKKMETNALNHNWEPIFFEEINARARIAKLSDLRLGVFQNDDLELRLWIGFGLVPLEGIVIKRSTGKWSAVHVRSINPHLPRRDYQQELPSPESGWESLLKRLTDEDVFTLPDSSQLQNEVGTLDGESFVVEMNMKGSYRTYMYPNPHLQKWPEAKQMIRIVKIILEEFHIHRRLLADSKY